MADGWITIGTELSTDKFDKQISSLEQKIKKEEQKAEIKINIKSDLEEEIKAYDTIIENISNNIKEIEPNVQKYYEARLRMNKAEGLGQKINTQDFRTTIENEPFIKPFEQYADNLKNAIHEQDKIKQQISKIDEQYIGIIDKVNQYKQQIQSINIKKQNQEVKKLQDGFKSVNNTIQRTAKKAGGLALAIFGIRSAYFALRRVSNDLASYDTQYTTNLEFIRYILTQAIAPVLRYIVNLTAKLLSFLNTILQAWFGINIFTSKSAEDFMKMKSGAGGTSKAVKEIKKQLTGFDEINMLTSQSDIGTGAGGVTMPDIDLDTLKGEPPAWMQWIIDNKGLIIGAILGIATALILLKFGVDAIKALGIGLLIWGIVDAIISLKEYLNDPSFKNFGKIITAIGIALLGLAIIINSVPIAIAGAIAIIVGIIVKNWEKIKAFFQKGIDWLSEKSDWIHEHLGNVIGGIYDYFVDRFKAMLSFADGIIKSIKEIFDGLIKFFKGVFTGNWKEAWEGLKQIVSGVLNGILSFFNYIIDILKAKLTMWGQTAGNVFGGAFKGVVNAVLYTVEKVLNSPIRAINSLIDIINRIPGVNLSRLHTFDLPRLKAGGIINMPNKGTLVGSAIAGESGREGVVPLTDQQAMAELGREIGKNVLINLTNVTTMNGRIIGRELKQVQSEQNFAYNM